MKRMFALRARGIGERDLKATVGVVSLGCSKNRVDTEQMLGMLSQAGYTLSLIHI